MEFEWSCSFSPAVHAMLSTVQRCLVVSHINPAVSGQIVLFMSVPLDCTKEKSTQK